MLDSVVKNRISGLRSGPIVGSHWHLLECEGQQKGKEVEAIPQANTR